jgi:hypothetical protein
MAWLIGDVTALEAKKLISRGWDFVLVGRLSATLGDSLGKALDGIAALPGGPIPRLEVDDCDWPGDRQIGVFVDNDLFQIMSGPEWTQDSTPRRLPV